MIHPTAIIHPKAEIAPSARIGPYAVIDEHVRIGEGCEIGPHTHLTGRTALGANNRVHAGAVIGDAPQDLRYKNEPTEVIIGEGNVIREHVTIHRSNKPSEPTRIGSHCLLMASSHVGHNSSLGSQVILANGALLGGHVTVEDGVFISGNCLVHQFTRIGTLALMQGRAGISKDLPPFTIATGVNGICGLNTIGLRRAGFSSAERVELRKLYHALFRGGVRFREALAAAQLAFTSKKARVMLDFLAAAKRGVCLDAGKRASADEQE